MENGTDSGTNRQGLPLARTKNREAAEAEQGPWQSVLEISRSVVENIKASFLENRAEVVQHKRSIDLDSGRPFSRAKQAYR